MPMYLYRTDRGKLPGINPMDDIDEGSLSITIVVATPRCSLCVWGSYSSPIGVNETFELF